MTLYNLGSNSHIVYLNRIEIFNRAFDLVVAVCICSFTNTMFYIYYLIITHTELPFHGVDFAALMTITTTIKTFNHHEELLINGEIITVLTIIKQYV
jgi:hypothetical protein